MNFSFHKKQLAEWIFWFAFVCEIMVFAVKKFDIKLPYESMILRLLCLIFCIKILLTDYTKKEWGFMIVCGVIGVLAYFASGRGIDVFFRASMMIFASKNISREKALKFLFYTLAITYGWTILQSLIGLEPLYTTENFGRGGIETRYVFGFSHANTLHFSLWSLMVLFIYLYHEKLRPWHYGILTAFALVLTYLTRSRTGGALMLLTLAMYFCYYHSTYIKQHKKLFFYIGGFTLLAALAFSAFVIIWGPDPILRLDSFLTGRIAKAYHGVRHANPPLVLSLFSQQGNVPYIDMGFVRLLYSFGIIPTLFYIAAHLSILIDDYQNDHYKSTIFLIGLIILTVIEAQQVNCDIAYNFTLIMLFDRWYRIFQKGAVPSAD